MTVLVPGLARLRRGEEPWQYLALPGGVAWFDAGELHVATGRYARGADYRTMHEQLHQQLASEEQSTRELRTSVRQLEEQMLKRLYEMQRSGAPK